MSNVFLDEKRRQFALIKKRITKLVIDSNELGVFTRPELQQANEKRTADYQDIRKR